MKRVWLMMAVAAVSALAAAAARADFEPTAWQFVRDITLPDGAAGLNARFAVDADVWENAQGPEFADLRILAGETEEIGLRSLPPRRPRPRLPARRKSPLPATDRRRKSCSTSAKNCPLSTAFTC